MKDNEKLIEEARRSVLTMDYERAYQGGLVGRLADALEAAEKAHTPTDDELEPITDEALWDFADDLLDSWNIEDQNPPSLAEDFRDRFVARFRLRATEVLR